MRIGIYAPNLTTGGPSGVERYTIELVRALLRTGSKHEFVLVTDLDHWPSAGNLVRRSLPPLGRMARLRWDRSGLRHFVKQERLDIVHCPKSYIPTRLSCPAVMTIHDVIFLKYPEYYAPWWRWYWIHALRGSAARARAVVCVSKTTAKDVEEHLPEAFGRIHAVLSGIGDDWVAPSGKGTTALDPRDPYFLYVGNLTARKNIPLLIDAFARVHRSLQAKLVLVGAPEYGWEQIRDKLRSLPGESYRHLSGAGEEQLRALYRRAVAMIYPTRYEGFGFPVLEAMASGCPVIASRAGALPELVGEAGVLIDPGDVDALAMAMRRMMEDAPFRDKLIDLGRARVREFSWDRTARETLSVYEAVVAG